jgi:uncharacterized protein YjbJ (UPF0337 family)
MIVSFCILLHQIIQEINHQYSTIKSGGKIVSSTQSKLSRFKYKKDSVMSLQDKAKAAAKNVEGKVQEAAGDLTGNHEAQAKGKAKQAQAKVSQK